MSIAAIIGLCAVIAAFPVLNFFFWGRVMTSWAERFRRRCERRYGVAITFGGRGHWRVTGGGPWYRTLGIELLQLAYFLGAFTAWALGMVCLVVVMELLT